MHVRRSFRLPKSGRSRPAEVGHEATVGGLPAGARLSANVGFAQETYALCRVIDEACEDIWFMAAPLGEGSEPSQDQHRFLNEFFQEEFSDTDDPLSTTKRDRVSRHRIRAAMNRVGGEARADPSTDQAVARTLYQAFSGFIHGAYVHIRQAVDGQATDECDDRYPHEITRPQGKQPEQRHRNCTDDSPHCEPRAG